MAAPQLVAVIGAVEPPLLRAFVEHYRGHGFDRFFFAFHFTEHIDADTRTALLDLCVELVGPPTIISQGPWHETVHSELRDHLRRRAGEGWQAIADIDEFHDYPRPVAEMVAEAEAAGSPIVGGVLFDRIAEDGSFPAWSYDRGLDAAYPAGGYVTHNLLDGNPNKAVLARSGVRLGLGSHRSPDHSPVNRPLVPVHHFKWRDGVVEYLERRYVEHVSGRWHELRDYVSGEAKTLLTHIAEHGGRIDVGNPLLKTQPAALGRLPDGWEKDSVEFKEKLEEFFRTHDMPAPY